MIAPQGLESGDKLMRKKKRNTAPGFNALDPYFVFLCRKAGPC